MTLKDMIACFETIPVGLETSKLPPQAPWFVFHPDAWSLKIWDHFIAMLSIYFFLEVPYRIAFRTAARFGASPIAVSLFLAAL